MVVIFPSLVFPAWGQANSTTMPPDQNSKQNEELTHRYRKSLNRLLKVCYVPATSAVLIAFFSSFLAAAINSTNEANKAAGTCH
jgi:hypothetical protein